MTEVFVEQPLTSPGSAEHGAFQGRWSKYAYVKLAAVACIWLCFKSAMKHFESGKKRCAISSLLGLEKCAGAVVEGEARRRIIS